MEKQQQPTPPPVSQSAQTQPKERTLGETLNTWVQTVGILIAAIWGFYTFVYKEIILPKSAPVNITVNLELKKLGPSATKGDLIAVEMRCSATNPSPRDIHLLPSAWIAYGVSITATPLDDSNFIKDANAGLTDPEASKTVQRHARKQKTSVIATGRLFEDTGLKPGEKVGRTVVFFVHQNDYDLVDLTTVMPSAADVRGIQLEWTLTENLALHPTLYPVDKNGKRGTAFPDLDHLDKRLELQMAGANAEISLWP